MTLSMGRWEDELALEFPELQEPAAAEALMRAVQARAVAEKLPWREKLHDADYVRETHLMRSAS